MSCSINASRPWYLVAAMVWQGTYRRLVPPSGCVSSLDKICGHEQQYSSSCWATAYSSEACFRWDSRRTLNWSKTMMPNCSGYFSLYQGKISLAETVLRCKSAPRGSKSLMMMALAAHERHTIHPGFLDRGIVASTAWEWGLSLICGHLRRQLHEDRRRYQRQSPVNWCGLFSLQSLLCSLLVPYYSTYQ
jgi:hypothetical protein